VVEPFEPSTPAATLSEGGLDAGTPTGVEDTTPATESAPTVESGLAAEAVPGRENGNNPEEAASMTPEDWASLARP
jgi:hypothetical protein